jgi:AbrB family looped-hinge helix DNA binding protein
MPQAKLSSKSQIVIPVEIRRKLGINTGDTLDVSCQGNVITISKTSNSAVAVLESCASPLWRSYTLDLRREREEWDK